MQGVVAFTVFLLLASSCSCSSRLQIKTNYSFDQNDSGKASGYEILGATTYFDVMNYGAKGDGRTDDSEAFQKAWADVCSASTGQEVPTLHVPSAKKFPLRPVVFSGPCKANSIHFQLKGTLVAPQSNSWPDDALYTWIEFTKVDNLILDGNGNIDGQGSDWWKSCTIQGIYSSCPRRPTALGFNACNGLRLDGLTHLRSPMIHISINGCKGVLVSNLHIIAPEYSPNTDGINIGHSSNVVIQDSYIATGDDCIAINGGSSFINITGVHCGPGHGISIGSLGDGGAYDTVEEVHVSKCNLHNTQNGVRIKTFQKASGFAKSISFKHISFRNVRNPIIIDQFYTDSGKPSSKILEAASAVQVSDVTYMNLHGTSASDVAIDLSCSDVVGCSNIVMDNINITSAVPGQDVYSSCKNVRGSANSIIPQVPCLS